MTSRRTQTRFVAGEIDPLLRGRLDVRAMDEGAATLRNVIVQASGGVTRRPGTRLLRELAVGTCRLVSLELPGSTTLLGFAPGTLQVIDDDVVTATLVAPWSAAQAASLRALRRPAGAWLAHPDLPPQEVYKDATGWNLRTLAFDQVPGPAAYTLSRSPFFKFAAADSPIQASLSGLAATQPIPVDRIATIRTNQPHFTAGHLYARLRLRGRQVTIVNVVSPTQVLARTDQPLLDGQSTLDWDEDAWSAARGWPVSFALHQDRLVVGGSRELPQRLWFSRSGRHLDFDPGTGLDDEALSLTLSGTRRHDVVALVAGRQLQLFTTGGEWVVKGFPVTPRSVVAELQTEIGSRPVPLVQPVPVDGATLFIGSSGRDLREFLFTDAEQAYQAADLAVLARHLLIDPIDLAFDGGRRLLLIARADGRLATVTLDRTSNVAAWSLQEFSGAVRATAPTARGAYLALDVGGRSQLARLDDASGLDLTLDRTAGTPQTAWTGLDALNGRAVMLMRGDRVLGRTTVAGGTVTAAEPGTTLTVGCPFLHVVEALPVVAGIEAGLDARYRLLRLTLRLQKTARARADLGNGAIELTTTTIAGPPPLLADVSARALGWRRALDTPPWRIAQDDPEPCTVLAATLEVKVTS